MVHPHFPGPFPEARRARGAAIASRVAMAKEDLRHNVGDVRGLTPGQTR